MASSHQELLCQARAQLDTIPTAHKLYTASKQLAISRETALCQETLDTLSVQCKAVLLWKLNPSRGTGFC